MTLIFWATIAKGRCAECDALLQDPIKWIQGWDGKPMRTIWCRECGYKQYERE
jgi:Zn ribbon nucleic-acid-binding protein